MKEESKVNKYIIWGIILMFLPVVNMLGVLLIIIGIIKFKKENKSNEFNDNQYDITQEQVHAHDYTEIEKDDITQEQVHAHDYTEIEKDDITQEEVHAHDAWDQDGPIKYNK